MKLFTIGFRAGARYRRCLFCAIYSPRPSFHHSKASLPLYFPSFSQSDFYLKTKPFKTPYSFILYPHTAIFPCFSRAERTIELIVLLLRQFLIPLRLRFRCAAVCVFCFVNPGDKNKTHTQAEIQGLRDGKH